MDHFSGGLVGKATLVLRQKRAAPSFFLNRQLLGLKIAKKWRKRQGIPHLGTAHQAQELVFLRGFVKGAVFPGGP